MMTIVWQATLENYHTDPTYKLMTSRYFWRNIWKTHSHLFAHLCL